LKSRPFSKALHQKNRNPLGKVLCFLLEAHQISRGGLRQAARDGQVGTEATFCVVCMIAFFGLAQAPCGHVADSLYSNMCRFGIIFGHAERSIDRGCNADESRDWTSVVAWIEPRPGVSTRIL
jgi:hypothetical protein